MVDDISEEEFLEFLEFDHLEKKKEKDLACLEQMYEYYYPEPSYESICETVCPCCKNTLQYAIHKEYYYGYPAYIGSYSSVEYDLRSFLLKEDDTICELGHSICLSCFEKEVLLKNKVSYIVGLKDSWVTSKKEVKNYIFNFLSHSDRISLSGHNFLPYAKYWIDWKNIPTC
jgi:hypothetical protein